MKNVYLLIGTQKAGTTTLYHILKEHPGINCAKKKESKFFFEDDLYHKGIDFYHRTFFDITQDGRPFLDIDPVLMHFDYIPKRIYQSLGPEVKFIVVLRNPALRAYSHYVMEKFRKIEHLSFTDAIEREKERTASKEGNLYYSYVKRGLYFQQIERYLKYFSLDHFKFFLFEEDFVKNREEMLRSICAFMKVSFEELSTLDVKTNQSRKIKSETIDNLTRGDNWVKSVAKKLLPLAVRRRLRKGVLRLNSSVRKAGKLPDTVRRSLIDKYFIEDINKLEKLIDRDLSVWKG